MRGWRPLVSALVSVGVVLALATPAGATTASAATSWGFTCNADYGWVRANWPTIRTDTTALTPVYFRALLDQYTSSGWKWINSTRWYVGVSDRYGRKMLDSSLGVLPYPFVGTLGHYFAYTTQHRSYAGPQLGPFFNNLPHAYYRIREQYSVNGAGWSAYAYVQGTRYTSCQV
jgi:hypothetical protein